MGIRVEHGNVADFAQLGALAGQAQRAEKEAERADRQRLAAMEMQQRQQLAQMEIQTKVGMAADAMMFEREQADINRRFQLQMRMEAENNDFQREERKRMEKQEKFDATMNAIDSRDDMSDKEKDDMKMLYTANEELPAIAVTQNTEAKKLQDLNRLFIMSDRLDKQADKAQQLAAQFGTEKYGLFRGKTKYTRQVGKTKKDATDEEVAMYQRAVQEYQDVITQKALLDSSINEMLGVETNDFTSQPVKPANPEQAAERATELATMEKPSTVPEQKMVIAELKAINPSAAMALARQWADEPKSDIVNNNQSSFRRPNILKQQGMTQSMGSFR